jgi:nitroimidazol reductase NimA-like FMN-containing flavoprotein (pyridoxamine 5'-phosphate oxidase superfamily)
MSLQKLPKMNNKEIEKLISEQRLCRIAFKGKEFPYIAPFQYVRINGTLYFHFTDYGKKISLLEKDNRVCVEIEKYSSDLSNYNFVILRGKLEEAKDPNERLKVIEKIVREGKENLSINFLVAHGVKKEEGWDSLIIKRKLLIVKLKDVKQIIGLKSP